MNVIMITKLSPTSTPERREVPLALAVAYRAFTASKYFYLGGHVCIAREKV